MSSTPTDEWQTYWCHECDLSFHLLLTTTTPTNSTTSLCPHCHHGFIELMDPSPTSTTDTTTSLLDSPSFLQFVQHFNLATDNNAQCDSEDDNSNNTIESIIPTIKITSCMLEMDPLLVCAVCKEQFLIDVEAKQLPCNHLYHPDCILPWLSNHNSCPLCRLQLETPVLKATREENWETWSLEDHDGNDTQVAPPVRVFSD